MSDPIPVPSAFPAFIDPKLEDVDGVIRGFDEAPTKFGSSIVVELELDNGERRALWLTPTVLKSQFARLRPDVGEGIHVEYLGLREGANAGYHDFRVSAPDRAPFKPDWDALGDQGEDEEAS